MVTAHVNVIVLIPIQKRIVWKSLAVLAHFYTKLNLFVSDLLDRVYMEKSHLGLTMKVLEHGQ